MKNIVLLSTAIVVVTTCGIFSVIKASDNTMAQTNAATQTQAVAAAATAFLKTLNTEQRQKVTFPFIPEKLAKIAKFHRTPDGGVAPGAPAENAGPEGPPPGDSANGASRGRPPNGGGPGSGGAGFGMGPPGGFVGEQYGAAVWSNYPVSDVLRPGLQLGSLTQVQRDAVTHLLQTLLSPMGYQKVSDIMGSDQALSEQGQNFCSGTACYTIAVLGEPSDEKAWMIEFGGHHLALNVVIAGRNGVMTPALTGAQPSVYERDGKTVRVLAQENDKAFALMDSLDEKQRKQAILNYKIGDLVLGPGHAGEVIQPEGLKASAMNDRQRTLLLNVISEWAAIVNGAYSDPRMAEVKAGLDNTYFAWSGPTTHQPGRNGSGYYRIQGPKLVIEFSPQGVGGDATNHVHTMYRDPTNDYGVKFTGGQ